MYEDLMRLYFSTLLALALPAFASAQVYRTDGKVVDAAGKEHQLKDASLIQGVVPLAWLGKESPPHLEFREHHSTLLVDGIRTYVPIASVKKIAYDHEKKNVTVTVFATDGKEATLLGPSQYLQINRYACEAERDFEKRGIAIVRFTGGDATHGFQSLELNGAKSVSEVAPGRKAVLFANDKERSRHEVSDLRVAYQSPMSTTLLPHLLLQGGQTLELTSFQELRPGPVDPKTKGLTLEVVQGEKKTTMRLAEPAPLDAKTTGKLVGLVGRTPLGYKVFPVGAIVELTYDPDKKAPTLPPPPEKKPVQP
jgi:hypothetical protein